ncbi:hypothetical protein AGMMS50239_13750 [Bacteroidia bacterium]|nr:hypothetical protein AGMMS50239_13750 [Bacteroidia bacterium]
MDTKNSYKQVVKSFGLFGGVQVFDIIIGLVRSKVLAELLGTVGVGLNNLIQQPLNLISTATGLGISFSGVRDIAAANGENDVEKISKTMVTVRRWAWLTGIIGMLVVIFFSPLLYKLTFNEGDVGIDYSSDYKDFILLSVILLMTAVSGGQTAILKGIRKLKDTAKTGLFGSFSDGMDMAKVGLYTTGANMTYRYVGLVFTAISIDYFPRLVGVQSNKKEMAETVNQQSEIAILVVAPLMIIYTAFLPVIVKILNTSEFLLAEFIVALRTDPRLSRYIHETSPGIENQKEWIRNYKNREAEGVDYYFMFSVDSVRQGLARIYDITEDSLVS